MDLTLDQVGDALVVSFPRRVNIEGEGSNVFKERLKGLVNEGHRLILVDLGNVGFVDSGGLGAMISALKVMRQHEGALVLANLSDAVAAVLRITRLIRIFDVYPSIEDALGVLATWGVRQEVDG